MRQGVALIIILSIPTCNPLHPGGFIDAQVVVEDLEDVAENEAEVL